MLTSGHMHCKTNSVYTLTMLNNGTSLLWVALNGSLGITWSGRGMGRDLPGLVPLQKIKLYELINQLHEFHTDDGNNVKIPISFRTIFQLANGRLCFKWN